MRSLFFVALFLGSVSFAEAHVPVLVEQTSLHDIVTIEEPEISHAFYGTMNSFPHTYEIRSKTPFHLFVQVLMPDIASSKNNVSGIIIKETGKGGRVEEVARLLARDAMWDTFYEPIGADSYRTGGTFERDVEPGVYRIEVSTPDNLDKYVLVVGKNEDSSEIGYFETIRRIAGVKAFYGRSKIFVVLSPLVYVPLLVLCAVGGVIWFVKRRHRNQLA